ncbi:P-loop containing nucleoside triphosphate hydrolase protein [Gigaspora margarita]|uniref:P-loop containing nucleoside triphosphate hydrolase protein n=1 Tax=Gigaspora margarita TaxID=4874 RepID=A0A8H4EQJ7_GIGMA|nr:P-loop containing nucleoside triphosphate hydrolase protein [Gigaspora margarita]
MSDLVICNGKSTLANVLVNDGNEQFKESSSSNSETKECKSVSFINNEFEYTVIDTPGLNDTNINNEKKVYEQIVRAVYSAKDGLNQILFVTKGRFTKEEYNAYKLLKDAFFNEGAIDFITIIRTGFPYYKDNKKCEDDINKTFGQLAEVIKECKRKVIHVDNPPIDVPDPDDIEYHKKKRKASRKILLDHLSKCDDTYSHEFRSVQDDAINYLDEIKRELKEYERIITSHQKFIQSLEEAGGGFSKVSKWLMLAGMEPVTISVGICASILALVTHLAAVNIGNFWKRKDANKIREAKLN